MIIPDTHYYPLFSCPQTSPKEDVLYATIDHGTEQKAGQEDNSGRRDSADCDYAVVTFPTQTVKKSDNCADEDCADDYVLMS